MKRRRTSRSSGRQSAQTSQTRRDQSRLTSAATELKEDAPEYRMAADVSPRQTSAAEKSAALSPTQPLRFIDLFCGCGGFTLGMERAGFLCLAAIDFNAEAVATLRNNASQFPTLTSERILQEDLTRFGPAELAAHLSQHSTPDSQLSVDMIVGGPPCQGFSKARQRDGANHGSRRFVDDPRRNLYREFLRYVDYFQPRVFVMENVLGLRNAAGGAYFTAVQKEARELGRARGKPGYRVHAQIEDAWELGAPQKRQRQLIIGVRNDLPGYFLPELKPAPRAEPRTWLGAALGDLPILRAAGGEDERDYDLERRKRHLREAGDSGRDYLFKVLEIDRAAKLTNHVARLHSERDLHDFTRLREGENSAEAMRLGVKFEFPYDKSSFKDRYTRQSRWRPCSTIVAHLSKDGLMFIHPTQNRSLTPREAARIQTFPDWFRFPKARTQSFRLIGNAVPPLVAEAVGLAAREFLRGAHAPSRVVRRALASNFPHPRTVTTGALLPEPTAGAPSATRDGACAPRSRPGAARELERLAQLDRRALRALPTEEFLRGWHALLFLFPGLHPDNALDHGDDIEEVSTAQLGLPGLEELLARRHARSGWPVALELIGREAWGRFEAGELNDGKFYCVEAQRAGFTDDRNQPSEMKTDTDILLRRLGQNLRARRTSMKLIQASLAAKVGCSLSHLYGIERGERSASILCLARLAKALQTTIEALCEGIDDKTRKSWGREAQ